MKIGLNFPRGLSVMLEMFMWNSILFAMVVTCHLWLLNTWNAACLIKKWIVFLYLILINIHLSRQMRLVATMLKGTDLIITSWILFDHLIAQVTHVAATSHFCLDNQNFTLAIAMGISDKLLMSLLILNY